MGLARGGAGGRGGGRGSGRGVHKKARGGPMMRPGPPPLMGPPGPIPPMGGPRMRPPPPGLMHQPPGVRPPPPGMRPPRPPPPGMVRPPPGFRPPPPGPHGLHGHHGPHGPHGPHGHHGPHGPHGPMGPMGPMGPHGPRMGPPGMPPRPPPPGMMRGRGGMMRPPMIPPWVGPPRPPGPPGGPFMMRAAREWRRGGMAGKGGKNRKAKGKSGTNRPQAELEAAELAKPWVNDVIRPEILKKHKLHAEARASKDVKDWEAFKEQKKKVAVMVNEAKLEYIGSHPEEESEEEDIFDADSSFGSYEEEDYAESSFEEGTDAGYVENESSQDDWQCTPSSYYNYDYSQQSLAGTDLSDSATATPSTNNLQNSVESSQTYESAQYQSEDSNDGYEGYDGYGYNAWNDPASQYYYNSYPQDPQQYYESSSQDLQNYYCSSSHGTTHNQWYDHQSYEQSHTSYQQYAVPYQKKTTEYSRPSFGTSSYAATPPRDQKNRSHNTPNANYNKQQNYRRKDEPLTLFYCESCDRSFPNDQTLKEHLSEHRVCGREGCKFAAHFKVVEKHIKLQHDTGLYRRIKSTDDTEKWRAERKKKFPSKENIEARQKQQQEMLSRGERLTFERNRFQNSRGRSNMSARGRGRYNNTNIPPRDPAIKLEKNEEAPHPSMPWRPQFPVPIVKDIELCTRGKLSKFPGTAFYKSEKEKVEETMSACDALSTLCDYGGAGSSDEDDSVACNENETATPNPDQDKSGDAVNVSDSASAVEVPEVKEDSKKVQPAKGFGLGEDEVSGSESTTNLKTITAEEEYESDGSGPEEVPILKEVADNADAATSAHSNEPRKRKLEDFEQSEELNQHKHKKLQNGRISSDSKSKGTFRQRGKENHSLQRGKYMPRRPPTLLEKLLAPDIQHERNIILQCIRYVVEQKFFNVIQKNSDVQVLPAN